MGVISCWSTQKCGFGATTISANRESRTLFCETLGCSPAGENRRGPYRRFLPAFLVDRGFFEVFTGRRVEAFRFALIFDAGRRGRLRLTRLAGRVRGFSPFGFFSGLLCTSSFAAASFSSILRR